jgi:dihydroorotase
MPATLTITRPDDWHVHLRDGAALTHTVPAIARYFGRAVVMPNLLPPVRSVDEAQAYRERIMVALPIGSAFQPLMTLYLTDNTDPAEIEKARNSGLIHAVKLYPAGATTHSDSGVTDINRVQAVLEKMAELDLPLLIHGEVTQGDVDIFDREKIFLDTVLAPLLQRLPSLRVTLEHITTADAVAFVQAAPATVGATITAHHLLFNRNHMLAGGIRPHYFCLPILKRRRHQEALIAAAISGNPKFFLGTDSAPHARHAKESACGCAGAYTAHAAIELYAEAFEAAGALDKLESFASFHGPDFYRLPRHRDRITLVKDAWHVPESYAFGDNPASNNSGDDNSAGNNVVVPIRAGAEIAWRVI